ncbi:MAG: TetR/AcrR family transcriptional regulator [Deltaproteobacteria bacterium]|nr:TetR/AcrR family transcriptional regulator [Deltaproteobacteria bacterium]
MNLKETIIHKSLRLFSLKGFLSTSLQDILEAAHTSKGGFYNHFGSKEELFLAVLSEAQRIWRERNLTGLDEIDSPVDKIKKLLENYRDRYLKDAENFPGGCVFVTLSVELDDQRPHLSKEINKGFTGFRNMLKGLLDQGKASGELHPEVDTGALAEMIFAGMLGASVLYGTHKSVTGLDQSLNPFIEHLERLGAGKNQGISHVS